MVNLVNGKIKVARRNHGIDTLMSFIGKKVQLHLFQSVECKREYQQKYENVLFYFWIVLRSISFPLDAPRMLNSL